MRKVRYVRVDVFATKPFGGNPLAVFPDARGLTSKEMQLLANEMNLSETTFVLPPTRGSGADFRVRIFVPDKEIPYAGHPTIGTFYVLAKEKRIKQTGPVTHAKMECGAGVLSVEIHAKGKEIKKVVTVQNKPEFGDIYQNVAPFAKALSLEESDFDPDKAPPQYVSTGLPWLIVPLKSRDAVERAAGNAAAMLELARTMPVGDLYLTCLDPVNSSSTAHSRALYLVSKNVSEDPATGSGSGCLGAYLVRHRLVSVKPNVRIINEQGYEIGRPSKIAIEVQIDEKGQIDSVKVGGPVVHMMDGIAYL